MGRLGIILFFSLFRISDDPVLSIIRSDAMKIGIPESYLNEAFSHSKIEIHDSILDRFARPYEKKTWDEYRKLFVTKNRINEGTKFFKSHGNVLTEISKELKNEKSVLFKLHFQNPKKTLEDNEVNSIIAEIVDIVLKKFNAKLRDQ